MNAHRARGRAASAFTLVEALIVIAGIAVLLSILAPSLRLARETARGAACLANERTIGVALVLYQNCNGFRFPRSSHSTSSLLDEAAWLTTLEPYGAIPEARRCPSDDHADQKLTSYATNDHFEPLTPGIDFHPITRRRLPGGRVRAFLRVTEVPSPSKTVYAVEPAGEGTVDHLHSVGWTRAEQIEGAIAVRRHSEGANYLFVDGHAERIGWPRLRSSFTRARSMFDPETAR